MKLKKIIQEFREVLPSFRNRETRHQVINRAKTLLIDYNQRIRKRKIEAILIVPILTITILAIIPLLFQISKQEDFAKKSLFTNIEKPSIKSIPKAQKPQKPLLAVVNPTIKVNDQAPTQVPGITQQIESFLHYYRNRPIDKLILVKELRDEIIVENHTGDTLDFRIVDIHIENIYKAKLLDKLIIKKSLVPTARMYHIDATAPLMRAKKYPYTTLKAGRLLD